jgi:hypothetical protein
VKRYDISIEQTIEYRYKIKAESLEEAKDKAWELYADDICIDRVEGLGSLKSVKES